MSMNQVSLHGRLVRDHESRVAQSGKVVTRFYLAVNSKFKDAQGNRKADYPCCVVFGKRAVTARDYLRKGSEIVLTGSLHTDSYVGKDGVKRYTTDVWTDDFDFCGSKKTDSNAEPLPPAAAEMGQPIHEEDIPF